MLFFLGMAASQFHHIRKFDFSLVELSIDLIKFSIMSGIEFLFP
ncbi:MAG: hypothetical protein OXG51_12980 [Gammaproteobacteria bacterium]|nr:hypothetical protein [Gammaproteobacteria bacterium]